MKNYLVVAVGLAGALACTLARADDADLSYGGAPSALKGTGQVSMQSEVVLLDIGPENVKADCQFVFKNNGPACAIRMGFPDGSSQHEDEADLAKPVQSAFTSFHSYVNGRSVSTSLVRGKDYAWHEKIVSFPAHSIQRVREVYTAPVGSNAGSKKPYATAYYVLQTGASWRGPIGRMEVIARFRRTKRSHPTTGNTFQDVRPVKAASLGQNGLDQTLWQRPNEEVVAYDGPGTPQVEHNVLRWVRTNIRPTGKDDVYLAFKQPG